jgi:TRAP-type mannitol/chloroaromatic compound transport system permease small subunit
MDVPSDPDPRGAGLRGAGARRLQRVLDRATDGGAWLVLPLVLLLCAQWPLRDAVAAGSRQANDLAQWIFALYVALAVRQATRRRAHMSADAWARGHLAPRMQAMFHRFGLALCVLPWALYVLASGGLPVWRSITQLESFPDTTNPLYFVIKASAWLLALLLALEAIVEALMPHEPRA